MTPLRRARADAMRIIINDNHGELRLDQAAFRWLAEDGWSRAAVESAVNDLVELGEVAVIAGSGPLVVRALEMVP